MHTHKVVLLKEATGDHEIRWCRECGMVFEILGGKIYEMVPSWSLDKLLKSDRSKEQFKVMGDKPRSSIRLGKGLNDIFSLTPKGLMEHGQILANNETRKTNK